MNRKKEEANEQKKEDMMKISMRIERTLGIPTMRMVDVETGGSHPKMEEAKMLFLQHGQLHKKRRRAGNEWLYFPFILGQFLTSESLCLQSFRRRAVKISLTPMSL
jgi:hypothetical protein